MLQQTVQHNYHQSRSASPLSMNEPKSLPIHPLEASLLQWDALRFHLIFMFDSVIHALHGFITRLVLEGNSPDWCGPKQEVRELMECVVPVASKWLVLWDCVTCHNVVLRCFKEYTREGSNYSYFYTFIIIYIISSCLINLSNLMSPLVWMSSALVVGLDLARI